MHSYVGTTPKMLCKLEIMCVWIQYLQTWLEYHLLSLISDSNSQLSKPLFVSNFCEINQKVLIGRDIDCMYNQNNASSISYFIFKHAPFSIT